MRHLVLIILWYAEWNETFHPTYQSVIHTE